MFTGIIEATAIISNIRVQQGTKLLQIERPEIFTDIHHGSSIACNGICLTVLSFDAHSFTVQVMNETLGKSTAGTWKNGDTLNLERALRLGDRLDGHWVMGHIDTTSRFLRKELRGNTGYYFFEMHNNDRHLMIPQGSIAIDGISLTIAKLNPHDFAVALIQHTEDNTRLPRLKTGEPVNLEYDALGKYILRSKN